MADPLRGLKILAAEGRELDLFAAMLEAEGATVLRCPLVRILDLEAREEADRWIDAFIAGAFEDLILLTGEGLRRLLVLSESGDRRAAFIAALARARILVRGPKPTRALRELGLNPTRAAPEPTSDGVLQALADEDLRGRKIGVQLYPGPGGLRLPAELEARGAAIFPVTPYRYASDLESAKVADAIRDLAAGRVDMIAFTSTPQIDRLAEVARVSGLERELAEGLARTPIASIGPVVTDKLKALGVSPSIEPKGGFHMKPLVRAIVAAQRINLLPGGEGGRGAAG